MKLPPLYSIVDAAVLSARGVGIAELASALRAAGALLIQYRAKDQMPREILRRCASISQVFAGSEATLILNDRSDLAMLAGWDGVHVGQEDLSPADAKKVLASSEAPHLRSEMWGTRFRSPFDDSARHGGPRFVGVSTHTEAQVVAAEEGLADYVAIGPVFATGTKLDAAAVVGLEGVRRARAMTRKPLVAIGGIKRENARSVLDAGADSLAVISALFVPGESVARVTEDFLEILR